MYWLAFGLLIGLILLVVCTDQFVDGASIVAQDLGVSPVLVGAVILGCGTGLPEFALAFYSSHESPWRQILGIDATNSEWGHLVVFVVVVTVLVLPMLFPDSIKRHSPVILLATVAFAVLLRGSLNRYEGIAMILGFMLGVALVIRSSGGGDLDPFAPMIADSYGHRAYIEAPVMTPIQVGILRSLVGLFGTAIGAQLLAYCAIELIKPVDSSALLQNVVLVGLGSLLPHVVVSLHALRQEHEGLAIGNLIGSSLFNGLVVGGLIAIIRPYQGGGSFDWATYGVVGSTAMLSWMLLSTDVDITRKQGIVLLAGYLILVFSTRL